jgi:methyl-accepting chemotaxis protein
MTLVIKGIVNQSEGLASANRMVAAVAAQTNLLAMNAAIEAAHAGEAGAGFSVVAAEIRNLAVTSANQSKSISGDLKNVLKSIERISEDNSQTIEAFTEADSAVRNFVTVIDSLEGVVNNLDTVARQVQVSMGSMDQINQMVYHGSTEMRAGNGEILTASTTLRTSSQEVLIAIEGIGAQTAQIDTASQALLDSNQQTDSVIQAIRTLVARIKTTKS